MGPVGVYMVYRRIMNDQERTVLIDFFITTIHLGNSHSAKGSILQINKNIKSVPYSPALDGVFLPTFQLISCDVASVY